MMSHGSHKAIKIRGGRTTAKNIDDWDIVCDPPRTVNEFRGRRGRGSYNRGRRGGRLARGGRGGAAIPPSSPIQFHFESEEWPKLTEPDHSADNREPAEPVTPSKEKSESQGSPTMMFMDGETIEDDWGAPSPKEPATMKVGESSTTKPATFDIDEFLKSNTELREMELAVVMAINDLRKLKVISDQDQVRLMHELPMMFPYQPPISEGSFFYPAIPLYSLLAEILEEWMYSGACYAKDLLTYEHLDEGNGVDKRKMVMDNVACHMMGFRGSWEGLQDDEKKHKISQLFKDIGKRGLLDLLGVRRTVGSEDVFPPTRDILEASFRELNKASSQLTVGARALEKHCHRDQTNNWWGRPKGSEKSKNDNAERVLNKILNEVGWLNIHQLPHALPILEVRNTEGYGARWSPDGTEFRGFLEPQMVAGWETGYKH